MLTSLTSIPHLEPAARDAASEDAHLPASGTRFADLLSERRASTAPAGKRDPSADTPEASDSAAPRREPQTTLSPAAPRRPPAGAPREAAESHPATQEARPSTSAQAAPAALEAAQEQSAQPPNDSQAEGSADGLPALPWAGAQPGAVRVQPPGEGAQALDANGARPSGPKIARDIARLAAAQQAQASATDSGTCGETGAGEQDAAGPIVAAPIELARAEAPRTGPEPGALLAGSPSFARALTQATSPAVALPTPLAAPNFGEALAAQVSVFVRDGVQQAELRLNPPEMGPIGVQIEVLGNDARINFHAPQANTREVIERALPELAAALRGEGLTLAGGGVFDRPAGGRERALVRGVERARSRQLSDEPAPVAQDRPRPLRQGSVDLYA